ncbi:type II and III secretion system protein [Flavobacterium sp. MAH-1]|uniref:Type II and III secretion system protein n=1 Tax=Flavobacterium agri TaxID=2743471 RepID=A0A7Y8Y0X4_9FLAO|nr:type II and III secretion system protein [Flavobacterium agri]NUY79266.1 type II and III secretion system protein [Flavobacterium agri]NYA69290.1 type II and III secretion system protein [Flavobacterium agri]
MIKKLLLVVLFACSCSLSAQQDVLELNRRFDDFAKQKKELNNVIKLDISGLSLYDLILSIAENNRLNVSVDSDLNIPVVNNFYDVTVKDAFVFLAAKYDLEVEFMSNIIIFRKRKEVKLPEKKLPKIIDVKYNKENDFLSVHLENDTLETAVQAIVDASGKNIIMSPEVRSQRVSAYILNRPFDQVVEMIGKSNGLQSYKDETGVFYFEKQTQKNTETTFSDRNGQKPKSKSGGGTALGTFEVTVLENGLLSVRANAADAAELLTDAAEKLHVNYFIYNKPENEKTSLMATGITFDDLLEHILKGKKYSYKKEGNFYLIGEHATEGLRATEMVQLENRSIELVLASLPKVFSEKLELKEFKELNGLIVSGPRSVIDELKIYLKQVDKVVPLVQIEVIIVQYKKAYGIQTGIKSGIDKSNEKVTSGLLFPTTDVTLNSSSVNSLIDAFNGLGFIKLGKVTDAFYLNLQFLENNSLLKIESTPKIATLSGHEATLSIGETNYYFEQNNQLINSGLGNNVLQSGSWKQTDANLKVSIMPFVSTDENVTLNIQVEKSSFLGRAAETAPPGKATQNFQSLVRVKNGEMVLLGGLDELSKENTGSGTPLISRIPIIKWFFSSRNKTKSNSKLHLFIKPTIVY